MIGISLLFGFVDPDFICEPQVIQDLANFRLYVWKKLGRKRGSAPDHGCWENLTEALKPWQIPAEDIPSPLNIFQTMLINAKTGTLRYAMKRPKPGTHFDLRAEMDCLAGISACPEGGRGKELHIVVYEK